MMLARAIHFDESDMNVFHSPARTGEWCISGGFEFSNWTEADLTGKSRQAFSNGWLGVETFGRVTFVAATKIEPSEYAILKDALSQHSTGGLLRFRLRLNRTGFTFIQQRRLGRRVMSRKTSSMDSPKRRFSIRWTKMATGVNW